jgi:hypothetical protein
MDGIIKAIESQKPEKGGGAKSWWRWPLLILLVLAGLAIAGWISMRNRRELAKLRHEKFKREELAKQAEVDAQVAENDLSKEKHLKVAARERERLLEADLKLKAAENRHAKHVDAIDRLGWGDLPRGD